MANEDDNEERSGTLDVPFPTWMTMVGKIKDPNSEEFQFRYPTSNLPKDERDKLLETMVTNAASTATQAGDAEAEGSVEDAAFYKS